MSNTYTNKSRSFAKLRLSRLQVAHIIFHWVSSQFFKDISRGCRHSRGSVRMPKGGSTDDIPSGGNAVSRQIAAYKGELREREQG